MNSNRNTISTSSNKSMLYVGSSRPLVSSSSMLSRIRILFCFFFIIFQSVVYSSSSSETTTTTTTTTTYTGTTTTTKYIPVQWDHALNPNKGRPASKIYSHYSEYNPMKADTGFLKVVASYTTSAGPTDVNSVVTALGALNGVVQVKSLTRVKSLIVYCDNLADQEAIVVALSDGSLGYSFTSITLDVYVMTFGSGGDSSSKSSQNKNLVEDIDDVDNTSENVFFEEELSTSSTTFEKIKKISEKSSRRILDRISEDDETKTTLRKMLDKKTLDEITKSRYRIQDSNVDKILAKRTHDTMEVDADENSFDEGIRLLSSQDQSIAPQRLQRLPSSPQPSFPDAASMRPPEDEDLKRRRLESYKRSLEENDKRIRRSLQQASSSSDSIEGQRRSLSSSSEPLAWFPNDSLFAELRHLHDHETVNITQNDVDLDIPAAWYRFKEINQANRKPVIVGVIDSGVDYFHEDLINQLWKNPNEIPDNGIDDDENGYIDDIYGIDVINIDGTPFDDNWHGTHNSGLIGATVNNNIGVAGIAGLSRLLQMLTCKFLNRDGSGTLSGALECIEYSIKNGAQILLLSFGTIKPGLGAFNIMTDVLNNLSEQNVFISSAAGNLGQDVDNSQWIPCGIMNIPYMLCTTAVKYQDGTLTTVANYGTNTIHLAAIGDFVKSTSVWGEWGREDLRQNGRGGGKYHTYWDYGGTSIAAAQVAGVAALLLLLDPRMTPNQIRNVIGSTTKPQAQLVATTMLGGVLSAYKAIDYQAFYTGTLTVPTADWSTGTISFTDSDSRPGILGGIMTLSGHTVGDAVNARVFFADSTKGYLAPSITSTFNINTGTLDLSENSHISGTVIPDKANCILICPISSDGLQTDNDKCADFSLNQIDQGIITEQPRKISLTITDEDTREGSARIEIGFLAAEDESQLSTYRIYQVDNNGNKIGNILAEVEKIGYHKPVVTGNDKDKISMIKDKTSETWEITRDLYTNNENAHITTWGGPGFVSFKKINMETNHDWIFHNGFFYSEALPTIHSFIDRSLVIGQNSFIWHTDFNVTDAGNYGTKFPFTPNVKGEAGWKMIINHIGDIYHTDAIIQDLTLGNRIAIVPCHHGNLEMPSNSWQFIEIIDNKDGPMTGPASGAGVPPLTVPINVEFEDQDDEQFRIIGKIEVQGSGNPETNIYKAYLEYTQCRIGCPFVLQSVIGYGITKAGGSSEFNIAYSGLPSWAVFPGYLWYIRVNECNFNGCNERGGFRRQMADVKGEPPNDVIYEGDMDMMAMNFGADITISPSYYAMGLTNYRLYWSSSNMLGDLWSTPFATLNLTSVSPWRTSNYDWNNSVIYSGEGFHNFYSMMPSVTPYSPRCYGDCRKVLIYQGTEGVYYITAGSAAVSYPNNEKAWIYFPYNGEISILRMDVEPLADKLIAYFRDGTREDLAAGQVGDMYMLESGTYRNILWQSDGSGRGDGWTLTYKPENPILKVPLFTEIAEGMTGFIVMPTYHLLSNRESNPNVLEASTRHAPYFEARDYIKPDALCTPSLMTCPILKLWSHFNYTVPDPESRPAFGSCEQVTFEGRNYFVFEKLKCGAYREFDDIRGTMVDIMWLSPDVNEVNELIRQASTTKSPNVDMGMLFISPESFEPLKLPPQMECGGVGTNAGGGGLLKMQDPQDPVWAEQLDMFGTNIFANITMRIYADPTYSFEVTDRETGIGHFPVTVERFYIEVSSRFTGDRVTIRECTASDKYENLNSTTHAWKFYSDYCSDSRFDVEIEPVPAGFVHIDRISTKKFKFQHTNDVNIQCKVQMSWQKPAGVCGASSADWGMNSGNSNTNTRRSLTQLTQTITMTIPKNQLSRPGEIIDINEKYIHYTDNVENNFEDIKEEQRQEKENNNRRQFKSTSNTWIGSIQRTLSETSDEISNQINTMTESIKDIITFKNLRRNLGLFSVRNDRKLQAQAFAFGQNGQQVESRNPVVGQSFSNHISLKMPEGQYDGSMIIPQQRMDDPEWVAARGAQKQAELSRQQALNSQQGSGTNFDPIIAAGVGQDELSMSRELPPVWSANPNIELGSKKAKKELSSKAIVMESSMSITSLTPKWAVEHRKSLYKSLFDTLRLRDDEDLHIVKIVPIGNTINGNNRRHRERMLLMKKMNGMTSEEIELVTTKKIGTNGKNIKKPRRRRLRMDEQKRILQAGLNANGVRIEFVVGTQDPRRSSMTQTTLSLLASGAPSITKKFSSNLDEVLMFAGEIPVAIMLDEITFQPVEMLKFPSALFVDSAISKENGNLFGTQSLDLSAIWKDALEQLLGVVLKDQADILNKEKKQQLSQTIEETSEKTTQASLMLCLASFIGFLIGTIIAVSHHYGKRIKQHLQEVRLSKMAGVLSEYGRSSTSRMGSRWGSRMGSRFGDRVAARKVGSRGGDAKLYEERQKQKAEEKLKKEELEKLKKSGQNVVIINNESTNINRQELEEQDNVELSNLYEQMRKLTEQQTMLQKQLENERISNQKMQMERYQKNRQEQMMKMVMERERQQRELERQLLNTRQQQERLLQRQQLWEKNQLLQQQEMQRVALMQKQGTSSQHQGGWMQQFFGAVNNRKQEEQHQYNSYNNNSSSQFGLGGGQQNIINQNINISNENTPSNSFDMATAYQMSLIGQNQQNNNFQQNNFPNQESSENVLQRQKEFEERLAKRQGKGNTASKVRQEEEDEETRIEREKEEAEFEVDIREAKGLPSKMREALREANNLRPSAPKQVQETQGRGFGKKSVPAGQKVYKSSVPSELEAARSISAPKKAKFLGKTGLKEKLKKMIGVGGNVENSSKNHEKSVKKGKSPDENGNIMMENSNIIRNGVDDNKSDGGNSFASAEIVDHAPIISTIKHDEIHQIDIKENSQNIINPRPNVNSTGDDFRTSDTEMVTQEVLKNMTSENEQQILEDQEDQLIEDVETEKAIIQELERLDTPTKETTSYLGSSNGDKQTSDASGTKSINGSERGVQQEREIEKNIEENQEIIKNEKVQQQKEEEKELLELIGFDESD